MAIVVCGHLCLDIIPGFPDNADSGGLFRPGKLSIVNAPVVSTGGAVSNVGISLHRLGAPTRLSARIGRDPFGRLIMEHLRAEGGPELAHGIAQVEGETSSYSVVLSPPGVDRIFLHCPGANDSFSESDVPDSLLAGADILHFGYPPLVKRMYADGGDGLARLFASARSRGAVTSLDMSLPDPVSESGRVDWRAFLARVLPCVDLFVPSLEELAFALSPDRRPPADGIKGVAALAEAALALGAGVVMVKLGEDGAYIRTSSDALPRREAWADRELYTSAFVVEHVAGTTGAGDAAIAGLLASLHRGLGPEAALTMAAAVGACCVEAQDATSGIMSWQRTRERVSAGWRRAVPTLPEDWRRAFGGVWRGLRDGGY